MDYVGLPLEGTFHVYDSLDHVLLAVEQDGVPRYLVCDADQLRKICAEHESIRAESCLYIKPDPRSPWYYMNSTYSASDPRNVDANVKPSCPFSKRVLRVDDDFFDILQSPANCVLFGVSKPVTKGSEMLLTYPLPGNQGDSPTLVERSAD